MKNKLITMLCAGSVILTSTMVTADEYPNYGIWNDQLSPAQALGRFQWLEKCYDGLLVEAWEKMFDVTTPTSAEEKIAELKAAWLYEKGALRLTPQYPTFGDNNHENPQGWYAGTSASDVCKTIPQGYEMIGLLTSFDYKAYCPARALESSYNSISNVSIGEFSNDSREENYSNFSGRIIQLTRGETVRVSMKEKQIHARIKGTWHVFADWNRNGVLDDTGEILVRNAVAENDEITFNLTVPGNASIGYTRLRITDDYAGGSKNPCQDIQVGEVEDYTLKIN